VFACVLAIIQYIELIDNDLALTARGLLTAYRQLLAFVARITNTMNAMQVWPAKY